MERNREVRRGAAANGLSRRRPRNNFRDSPEEEGTGELQESIRLRDRAGKKDRPSRNKRRRGERLHGNREEGGEESTEESVDEDEEEEDEEAARLAANQRKTFPTKIVRTQWKVSDEVIGVSVPRKARSASAKRSHECWTSGGGVEQIHRQSSTSPARTSAASVSPSSSNVSVRKRVKPSGTKNRPPKLSKSSIQEIEIEVAEVLYGLTRQFQAIQCPSKPEISSNASPKLELKNNNGSNNDLSSAGRSRVSSPVPPSSVVSSPVSPSPASHPSVVPQNSSSVTPSQAVAPKRKRPRPVRLEEEISASGSFGGFAVPNASASSAIKIDRGQQGSQPSKTEDSSPKVDRISGPVENGASSSYLERLEVSTVPLEQRESVKPEKDPVPELKPLLTPETKPAAEETELPISSLQNELIEPKEETVLPLKESSPPVELDVDLGDVTPKPSASSATPVSDSPLEKLTIDLMATPAKSSPDGENEGVSDFIPDDQRPQVHKKEIIPKMEIREGEEARTIKKQETGDVGLEEVSRHLEPGEKSERGEECELQTQVVKERMFDLHLDAEILDKDSSSKQQAQKHPKVARNEPKAPNPQDKTAQLLSSGIASASFPLPIPVAGWPGSLPPLGYMGQAPANWSGVPSLQAVVSMDENAGSSTLQPHLLLPPPRPKRCATHFHIAQNICYHQQLARMNPFLAAVSSKSMYGSKQYNLNMMPPTETSILGSPLQGTFASSNFAAAGRNMASVQDKCHGSTPVTSFTGHVSKDKSLVTISDAQRKQLLLQQAPHPAPASGILPGPAIIFPMNQPSARSGGAKSAMTGNAASSATPVGAANSIMGAPVNSGSTTTVSYNYANLPTNEAQYLAILQNNGYPFPIPPTHAAAAYRLGSHCHIGPQVSSPFFNGPFYSSQMLHPSHIQAQSQPQPIQHGQQNPSTSSGSSSSQKHQQRRLQGGSSHNFPTSKQQRQQQGTASPSPTNSHLPPQARQIECELGTGEDSPSTAESRVSLVQKNFYNQNHPSFGSSPLAVPIPPQNFALMSSALGGKQSEKQPQPQQQQQQNDPHLQFSLKGMELSPSQAFAMPFASFNGAPGLDFSSMAQNHAVFQSIPEAARPSYQIAAQVAQQNAQRNVLLKNHQVSVVTEDGKTVSDAINVAASEEERKMMAGKASVHAQPLTFSKPDNDASITQVSNSTILGNGVESSGRTLSLISAPANGNRASCSPSTVATPASNALKPRQQQQQQQQQQQLQQQLVLKQQQQQQIMARTKPSTGNANVTSTGTAAYTDRPSSCSNIAKFSNTLGVFPQALIQGNPQSLQWKTAGRAATPVPPSASATSSTSLKNPPHQGRNQHANNPPGIANHSSSMPVVHTQISFGASPKTSANPPPMVGSPPASVSKTAGSPSSRVSKAGSATTVSQPKNSPANSGQKSSPVSGRAVSSILGQSHMTQSKQHQQQPQHQQHQAGLKTQQQQQQQQVQKHAFQQNQLFFSNAYLQAQTQSPQSAAVYYQKPTSSQGSFCNNNKINNAVPRRPSEQPQQQQQQQQQQQNPSNNPNPSTTATLSMCAPSLTLAGAPLDPTKSASLKGPPPVFHAQFNAAQSTGNSPHPLMAAAFPYIHTVPPVPLKPAEQKPAAGNDNLHACWQPEKR